MKVLKFHNVVSEMVFTKSPISLLPQGESYVDVVKRLSLLLPALKQQDDILIVSHQATIRYVSDIEPFYYQQIRQTLSARMPRKSCWRKSAKSLTILTSHCGSELAQNRKKKQDLGNLIILSRSRGFCYENRFSHIMRVLFNLPLPSFVFSDLLSFYRRRILIVQDFSISV